MATPAPAAPLKLVALDAEDLSVVSAHVQDAVLKVRDLVWNPGRHRFALGMNRFAWERAADGIRTRRYQRRLAALHFDRVLSVKAVGIDRGHPDAVLALLAVAFTPTAAPAGDVSLVFAGGGEIRLAVECIEARLADLGAAWQTNAKPAHDLADPVAGSPARPAR